MEKKKVMWIDSSCGSNYKYLDDVIIKYTFAELWRNAIDNKVLFIDGEDKKITKDILNDEILFSFFDVYNANMCDDFLKGNTNDKKIEFLKAKAEKIKNRNENKEDLVYYIEKNKSYNPTEIFSTVKNSKDFIYMLRLDLLENENDILYHNYDEKVLSMDLYYFITNVLKAPCILYSDIAYCNRIQKHWKEKYLNQYKDAEENSIKMMYSEDLNFHHHSGSPIEVMYKKRNLINKINKAYNEK